MKVKSIGKIIISVLVIATCAVFLPLFVIPMFSGIINVGNVFGCLFLTAVFLIWAFFPVIKQSRGLFVLFLIFLSLSIAGLLYAGFLSVNMIIAAMDKPEISPEKERTVIVLGCQIHGDQPSAMLARRLAVARDYLLSDPNAVCVVTGGLGKNETHTEADVMRNWLINNGISEERIFKEEKSTSTAENLKYAYDVIIQNNLPEDIIIVSDGFHIWRGKISASKYFSEIHALAAHTIPYIVPTYWVREWFALTKEFF